MQYLVVLFVVLVSVISHAATEINISGEVQTIDGNPIAGATLSLVGQNIQVTSTADGGYQLIGTVSVRNPSFQVSSIRQVRFENGILNFTLQHSSRVTIDMFDMHGTLLKRVLNHTVAAGVYRYTIGSNRMATRMMVIRVSLEGQTVTFRFIPCNGYQVSSQSIQLPVSAQQKKTARGGISDRTEIPETVTPEQSLVDSLKVSTAGYESVTIPLSSFQEVLNINLLPEFGVELPKFSFFLTSLYALQQLSGSDDGFGGDLRFGKTGPGAGLLGADSICECIAEKSMPGSKVKEWRAFLSAKSGPDGIQVNAIDRIGHGPWYDRLGRLVAYNKNGLLNNRPNGHSAIKSDLPNEDGIPNHQPDPNDDKVDNHLTVTGSNSKGQWYNAETDMDSPFDRMGGGDSTSGGFGGWFDRTRRDSTGDSTGTRIEIVQQDINNSTCDDWTSSSADSRPRAGFSWPQAMAFGPSGESHWISGWSLSGCEPGIDLSWMTGAGKINVYTIGNGGGYGGFYCFALYP